MLHSCIEKADEWFYLILKVGKSSPIKDLSYEIKTYFSNVLEFEESNEQHNFYTVLRWRFAYNPITDLLWYDNRVTLRSIEGRPLKLREWYEKLEKESFW